ncbi:CPP1-like family protein [Lyngbya aestuarii]|uniref:CPP1-like family protein n=1 Tax=Lyngbya aestuarii TaxID=118322 RepID=UPI00403DB1F0
MTDQNPYEKLGVTEDASFDEIQDAKGRLMQQHRHDKKLVESVEAAYDAIIMDRLRMRQEGKIKVPERIRFPEKTYQSQPSFPQVPMDGSPAWLQELLDTPTASDIIWPGVSFLALASLSVFYSAPGSESTLPLVLALGFGCSIYFVNRKEQKFWRAVLLTLIGLLIGFGLGSWLGSLMGTPIAGINDLTSEKFATLVTFFILWLISSFLR